MPFISDADYRAFEAWKSGRAPAPGSVTIANGQPGGPTTTDQQRIIDDANRARLSSLAAPPVNTLAKADAPASRWQPGMPERMETDWQGWKPSGPGWFFSAKENTWRNSNPAPDQKQFSADWYQFHNYQGRLGEKPPAGATWDGRQWVAPAAPRPPAPAPANTAAQPPIAPPPPKTSVPPTNTAPTAKTQPRDQGMGPNPSTFPTVVEPAPAPIPAAGGSPRPSLRPEGGGGLPKFDLRDDDGFIPAPPVPVRAAGAPTAQVAPPPQIFEPPDDGAGMVGGPGGGGFAGTASTLASDDDPERRDRPRVERWV